MRMREKLGKVGAERFSSRDGDWWKDLLPLADAVVRAEAFV
jgi:hypothetical protein